MNTPSAPLVSDEYTPLIHEARKCWWEIVELDEGECRMMGIIRELADAVEALQSRRSADVRGDTLEEAARVAEAAIRAGERVRDAMAPASPIDGLENALHQIVVKTAQGIARNIRALIPSRGEDK